MRRDGRKTKLVWRVQMNEGVGWSTLTQRDTEQEALDELAEYQLNDPDPRYQVITKRVYFKRDWSD